MPMVVIEAMAQGLAPIVTRLGSLPEIIVSGRNGLLMDFPDEATLSGLIQSLMDRARLRTLSREAACFAHAAFDARKTAQEFVAIYRSLRS